MQARSDSAGELHRMQEELMDHFSTLPGFIDGYLLASEDGTGCLGRVTVWESAGDADRASQEQHVLVVRSEMSRHLSENEEHRMEQGFEAIAARADGQAA
jgi:hypothetical protein